MRYHVHHAGQAEHDAGYSGRFSTLPVFAGHSFYDHGIGKCTERGEHNEQDHHQNVADGPDCGVNEEWATNLHKKKNESADQYGKECHKKSSFYSQIIHILTRITGIFHTGFPVLRYLQIKCTKTMQNDEKWRGTNVTKEERKKEMYEIMEAIEMYSEEQLDELRAFVLYARAQSGLQNPAIR